MRAKKTKEMTAERVLESCLQAMADGDEEELDSCLMELDDKEDQTAVIGSLTNHPNVKVGPARYRSPRHRVPRNS